MTATGSHVLSLEGKKNKNKNDKRISDKRWTWSGDESTKKHSLICFPLPRKYFTSYTKKKNVHVILTLTHFACGHTRTTTVTKHLTQWYFVQPHPLHPASHWTITSYSWSKCHHKKHHIITEKFNKTRRWGLSFFFLKDGKKIVTALKY